MATLQPGGKSPRVAARKFIATLLISSLVFLTACQKTIDNTRVSSTTPSHLTFWTSQVTTGFPPETSAQIRDALNEFKLAIYRVGKASTPADVQDHLCAEIDKLTVRELLIRGCELKDTRLQIERDLYRQLYANHMASWANPSNPEAVRQLEFHRESSKKRLDSLNAALSENAARLIALRPAASQP